MALPTAPSFWSGRSRALEQQLVRHREQEARFRRQWELNSLYFKQSGVYSSKQAQWSSRQSYEQSMNAYRREKLKEEKRISLERRRRQLQALLFEEREMLATELQALRLNKDTDLSKMRQKTEDLKSAREEQRKQIAEDRLYECWKKNSAKLREVESELHKQHVVEAWGTQLSQKQQREAAEREEESRTENEYEAARREALERLKEQEERRRQDRQRQAELLRQQVEELQLREAEAAKLKKEEENLLRQHWELEALEGERRRQEQNRKKIELGRFLKQQWHAQLKRRAQQIQADLEKDRQILQALAEEEDEEQRLQSARRERAVAAVAWMKEVIEEQLRLEREREAELETVFREEAKQVWERREQQWAREQEARDRLMAEVLAERARQIQEKVQLNRRAQEESVQCREQLIQGLEEAKRLLRLEKEGETVLKTARRRELEAQLTERRLREQEERERQRQEEAEARLEEQRHEALEQLEARRMAEHGYRSKPHSCPKTAWA
ncbi:trichoplein keratin filament-binding protein isoform X1 [Varanus komodoensis]|uniref:trichoplein keratin filament-binding protein isoform X1 n=1 Tax=Varanus komodoensis TaxID=61221 RepID=UPI001CF768F6|nr:trichoplein keratin filament-binding protein isoform X1 [Varanus komodoensis]XP_044296375.1 trichoplein keratin filament-binding protein isoform X1 [Varanus komodoensis]XP_044296376.1 trichoplein keratin filament-binding protein isoform X1 [Varanus komodoensis]XP_044296377.1 trichoplein keratin filament-binding protein isoform X1 [Varanus komodoensis]XP_044296378.1 trichoplein keratin filament-binding protein isoform X1 [Varanus komodoensis]XP_044296379.1 trichoplein keratin filament-bindin